MHSVVEDNSFSSVGFRRLYVACGASSEHGAFHLSCSKCRKLAMKKCLSKARPGEVDCNETEVTQDVV